MPLPHHLKDIPLLEPYDKLSDPLGIGWPIYFQLKVFLMLFYAVLIAIVTIYSLVLNMSEDKASEWSEQDQTGTIFLVATTIGSRGKDPQNYRTREIGIMLVLHTVAIVVILLLYALLK